MGGEPVELLADVGLGGDQHRFLVQPVGIEAVGGLEQDRDLLGDALLDRVGPARRGRLGAADQGRDLVEPRRQDAAERLAFAPAHLDEAVQHRGEACDHRGFDGAALILALVGVDDLDDALDGEQMPSSRRTLGVDAAGQLLDHGEHRGQAPPR